MFQGALRKYKDNTQNGRKLIANHVSRIYKECLQFNDKKKNNTI